ncbi:MAG: DUF4214 domain-containing protein, partial [Laribacter sp.]|nr:DUF4214 domain-containing protein [Laribacter sp.]
MAVPAKNIHELYVAYWGRAADPDGLAYWLAESQKEGVTLEVIAKSFSDQAEAQAAYPLLKDPTLVNDPVAREAFLTQVYQNLLGRAPDAAGLAYWSDVLAAGGKDAVGRIIIDIVGGAQGDDAQLIANKVAVSDSFASAADKAGLDHTSNGLLDAANGALNGVTKDPASVDAANQANQGAIDQIAGDINSQTISLTENTDAATANVFNAGMVYTPGGNNRINALQDEDTLTGTGTNPILNASLGNSNDNGATTVTPKLAG